MKYSESELIPSFFIPADVQASVQDAATSDRTRFHAIYGERWVFGAGGGKEGQYGGKFRK